MLKMVNTLDKSQCNRNSYCTEQDYYIVTRTKANFKIKETHSSILKFVFLSFT